MKRNTFSEEEAIRITIENGYNGSEFKTQIWKDRGSLIPNRSLEGLIKKLETIYEDVVVRGKGKKREYMLRNKKEKVSEIVRNYKGTLPTRDDETVQEYILNCLSAFNNKRSNSYNKWAAEFKFPSFRLESIQELENEVKDFNMGNYFNSKEVVSEFLNALRRHTTALVKYSFNRLEKYGNIRQSSVYVLVKTDGTHEIVSKEEYDEVNNYRKEFIESLGVNYQQYILSYQSYHKTRKMQDIVSEVNFELANVYGVNFIYEMKEVEVTQRVSTSSVSKEEFEKAYFQKFLKLAKDRQSKKSYQETNSYWKKNYLFNTVNILSFLLKGNLDIEELENLKKEVKLIGNGDDFSEG